MTSFMVSFRHSMGVGDHDACMRGADEAIVHFCAHHYHSTVLTRLRLARGDRPRVDNMADENH